MTEHWQPYREPLSATFVRTGVIAAVLGAVLTLVSHRGIWYWPAAVGLMLWPALGGHWVEVFFLNGVRPALARTRLVQAAARVLTWCAGGCLLAAGMYATAVALHLPTRRPAWWVGGAAFIGIELIAHLVLQARGRGSFYNGRG